MNTKVSGCMDIPDLFTHPPLDPADQIVLWKVFYEELGLGCEVFDLHPPKSNDPFHQLIVIPVGITVLQTLEIAQQKFDIHFPKGVKLNFDDLENQRNNTCYGYEIWVHDWINPDIQYLNVTANEILKKGVKSITLLECLLFELMFFMGNKKHLDRDFSTLCAGTRFSNNTVPVVGRHGGTGGIYIHWCDPDVPHKNLSIREVVA